MLNNRLCPNCESSGMSIFYSLANVPVHSVLLLPTREEALAHPRGDISLGFCRMCGFISNLAFDPGLLEYSNRYEATQGFSATFNEYHEKLARSLIERYDLHNKIILEIGCGQGEFLTLLCEIGSNRGIGFDPVYNSQRNDVSPRAEISFVQDFYTDECADYHVDFICCKMTLEHIHRTADFVRMVRHSIDRYTEPVVFFQVPDVTRILRECAFWDIYYEHCSYFSPGSLARLFQRCGFNVIDLNKDYGDQYLLIGAKPSRDSFGMVPPQADDLDYLTGEVAAFVEKHQSNLTTWRQRLLEIKQTGQRAVIWGAGSKGVAFLTGLEVGNEIEYAVDINPHKHGTYMAGQGQKIVGPEFLQEYRPDVVIVMNPIYCNEIQADLDRLGVSARLLPVL